ncbi:hypothetical protein CSOJ01_07944 [Colletotrichum sojae]|uniref:Uncharacterized protein n=1 Tax=Colletotrichum sojae TaxID=2175907 RepID=A0A8H6J7B3_9PEZI|nr:hypothetical protein CSOJ01_07944 [Colletotrichum sojae]
MPTRHPAAQRSQIHAEDEEQLAEGNGRKTPDGRREDKMWYQAGNPTPKQLQISKPFPDVREVREVGEEAGWLLRYTRVDLTLWDDRFGRGPRCWNRFIDALLTRTPSLQRGSLMRFGLMTNSAWLREVFRASGQPGPAQTTGHDLPA